MKQLGPGLLLHSIQPTALLHRRLKVYSLERLIKIWGCRLLAYRGQGHPWKVEGFSESPHKESWAWPWPRSATGLP